MKTLLRAKHSGQHVNGAGGCHTRWANDGFCCGVQQANWLNNLGDDSEIYLGSITNYDVRMNWLRNSNHLEDAFFDA